MREYRDISMKRSNVEIDNCAFYHCQFEDCVLSYSGLPCYWEQTKFLRCTFKLAGPAQWTFRLLANFGFIRPELALIAVGVPREHQA